MFTAGRYGGSRRRAGDRFGRHKLQATDSIDEAWIETVISYMPRTVSCGAALAAALALIAAAKSQPVTGGEQDPDLSDLLVLLAEMPAGDWLHVNKDTTQFNSFASQWPAVAERPISKPSHDNPATVIRSWSGFAWDPNRGDLWLFGGGHQSYSGNEVYRWRGTTRNWQRMSAPSQMRDPDPSDNDASWFTVDGATVTGPDSAPAPAHTYDSTTFLPVVDRLLVFGGADYNNGGPWIRDNDDNDSLTGPYFFDPNKADPDKVGGVDGTGVGPGGTVDLDSVGGAMWENRDIYANLGVPVTSPRSFVNSVAGYSTDESGRDTVYVGARVGGGSDIGGSQNLFKYTVTDVDDPTADLWEQVGKFDVGTANQGAGAYHPLRNVFVRTGQGNVVFTYWDLSAAGADNGSRVISAAMIDDASGEFELTETCGTVSNLPCDGFDYHPQRGEFLLWSGGGGTVWSVKLPADLADNWTVTKLEPSTDSEIPPADPNVAASPFSGVLGKWKYIPNLRAFMALENPQLGNIWLYKPFGWRSPVEGIFADQFD